MKKFKLSLAVLVAAGVLAAGAARADDWRDHERAAHEWHEHHHHHHPVVIEQEPEVVYAPPVVVEPPPAPEPEGFNLVIPLNIH